MTTIDLDLLRSQAETAKKRGNPLPTDPVVIIALLDTIATLMDDDSILAQGQRVAKDALDKMIEARKERDAVTQENKRLKAEIQRLELKAAFRGP